MPPIVEPQPSWSPAEPDSIDALQVVYKIAERCNIDCTYCYYFNLGDETALSRPSHAAREVTESLARWLAQGCRELRIPHVKISFHGGEPTVVGVEAFAEACRLFRRIVEPVAKLSLSIQTNGTLLDDRWVQAFAENTVGVGVSIDGPKEANDRFRLDRRGRSTFASTEAAIRQLVAAQAWGGSLPSTISVLHHDNDGRELYGFLRELGVREMNFLLPDRNAADTAFVASGEAALYGRRLAEIFSAWLDEDDPGVRVKFVDEVLMHFRSDVVPGAMFARARKTNQVMIARSDGTVTVDDSFIPALGWYAEAPVFSTASATLRECLADPVFSEIDDIGATLPTGCRACRWRRMCRGGDLENRFSKANGFDNPSVYCDAYKILYQHVCDELIGNGYPAELVASKFGMA